MTSWASRLFDWAHAHPGVLTAVATASTLLLVVSALLAPWLIARLPADYFVRPVQPRGLRAWLGGVVGLALIVAGIFMLVLPGQGILTILAGLALLPFPGRRRLIRRLGTRPAVMRGLNAMRRRAHRPAFIDPSDVHTR